MTQRDKMRQLFHLHGENDMEEILRQYAQAEASGEVRRRKKGKLTTEEYAVLLYKDGIKKGWIREHPASSNNVASTKRVWGELQEHGSTTSTKQIPTCELTPELLPEDGAPWPAILKFAYSFDGYDYWPEKHKCGEIGNSVRQEYRDTGRFQVSIDFLRTALFFEARRYHHFGIDPDREALKYIWALISEIRRQLTRNPKQQNRIKATMADFPTINRFAVALLPTEACLAWVRSCPGGDNNATMTEMRREPTIFLIPDAKVVPEDFVRRRYKDMFEQELNSWYTDPDMWPQDKSFKTFKKFFDVNISTVVFDLGKGPIEKDDD